MNRRHFLASTSGVAAFLAIRANTRPVVEPRHRESGVYATAGEKTYCAKGCLIGHFGNTVYVGAMPEYGDLVPESGMGLGATACPFCTAPVTAYGQKYFMESRA